MIGGWISFMIIPFWKGIDGQIIRNLIVPGWSDVEVLIPIWLVIELNLVHVRTAFEYGQVDPEGLFHT